MAIDGRKRQQQEDESMKKSLALSQSMATSDKKETRNFHIPN
jgi:hypothetical protein